MVRAADTRRIGVKRTSIKLPVTVARTGLRSKTRRIRKSTVYCSSDEKLQVVFVGTEVSPWSKVGGLGDVLSALPAALAKRGHRVMTVVPRYAAYEDVYDTGMLVPVELPPDAAEKHASSLPRLYLCHEKGVDRVFVDHPLFEPSEVDDRCPNLVYPYGVETGQQHDYELCYSVLCQVALAAPVLLWTEESGFRKGFMFVGNDWPCGVLPFWLEKYGMVAHGVISPEGVEHVHELGESQIVGQNGAGQMNREVTDGSTVVLDKSGVGSITDGDEEQGNVVGDRDVMPDMSTKPEREGMEGAVEKRVGSAIGGPNQGEERGVWNLIDAVLGKQKDSAGDVVGSGSGTGKENFVSGVEDSKGDLDEGPGAGGNTDEALNVSQADVDREQLTDANEREGGKVNKGIGQAANEKGSGDGNLDVGITGALASFQERVGKLPVVDTESEESPKGMFDASDIQSVDVQDNEQSERQPGVARIVGKELQSVEVDSSITQNSGETGGGSKKGDGTQEEAVVPYDPVDYSDREVTPPDLSSFQAMLGKKLTRSKVALIIHNLAYQGRSLMESFQKLCLPERFKNWFLWKPVTTQEAVDVPPEDEGQGEVNWLKAGLTFSDAVFTVSPGYGLELMKGGWEAFGLLSVLNKLEVNGIMNGIDVEVWDPMKDTFLPRRLRYDIESVEKGKRAAKMVLQEEVGLDVDPDIPVFGFVGRLEQQKGVDIILSAVPELFPPNPPEPLSVDMAKRQKSGWFRRIRRDGSKIQLVMLGKGERWMEEGVKGLNESFPGRAAGVAEFREDLAHLMMAGCDFMLVPSRFEPCGLVALCAVRYGTVPIVSPVGGLKDLVVGNDLGYSLPTSPANMKYRRSIVELIGLINQASSEWRENIYRDKQKTCMEMDVSWQKPAIEWEALLERLLRSKGDT